MRRSVSFMHYREHLIGAGEGQVSSSIGGATSSAQLRQPRRQVNIRSDQSGLAPSLASDSEQRLTRSWLRTLQEPFTGSIVCSVSESLPAPAAVQSWIAAIDKQLEELQSQLEPLLSEQVRMQEQRKLLLDLYASLRGPADESVVGQDTSKGVAPLARLARGETVRERVHRQAVEVFADVGKPLHVEELHAEFRKRGYIIPGAGKPANITVHLAGWDDIVSPARGKFGLAEHCDPVTSRSTKLVTRTRRKASRNR